MPKIKNEKKSRLHKEIVKQGYLKLFSVTLYFKYLILSFI